MLDVQQHRGPDGRNVWASSRGDFALGHDRLAIIDVSGGSQPIANEDGSLWVAVNGEIYNHQALRRGLDGRHSFRTGSDSEVVLHLFEEEGPAAVERLDGMFAVALWGPGPGLLLARDPLGIKPLYYGRTSGGGLSFGSEIKALLTQVPQVRELANGSYWALDGPRVQYYLVPEQRTQLRETGEAVDELETVLVRAVEKRLMSDVPLGVFLSGGLDSSLIAAIARGMTEGVLHSFSVGLEGAADLENARRVAGLLGTHHHERPIRPEEIHDALPRVIWHLESCDPALVRSAIPTYFVSELASQHVKVVLSGEGADELFAGYRYLDDLAEDPAELSAELRLITSRLHNSNLQRVDRMTMAHGLEARVPFLDRKLVDLAFRVDPALKHRTGGKWVLRKCAERYLPADIVWREKEKFAVGTGIGPLLEAHADVCVSDDLLDRRRTLAGERFRSKEELLYWSFFQNDYGREDVVRGMGRSRSLNPGQRWESGV